MTDIDLDELRAELDEFAQPPKKGGRSPREERVIAGFEDILRFVETQGHPPRHGEEHDIFERLYAVRLGRIRAQEDCRAIVAPLDRFGLLGPADGVSEGGGEFVSDQDLLAELGAALPSDDDIRTLKHVRPREEIRAAEEIANRKPCKDFAAFEPVFEAVRADLKAGTRISRRFREDAGIRKGEFFILGGQIAYVVETPDDYTTEHGHAQGRLRVVFDNGTESDPLLRSFQRALYKDEGGRRITDLAAGPLFGEVFDEGDIESGTIYVLRSKSDAPEIAPYRDLLHKVGVTGADVEARIAQARTDATFLLADVEILATYKLADIDRFKLENLLHRVLAPARFDLTIRDRFGRPVQPREWYMVPLAVIDEVVQRIRDGTIVGYRYDAACAELVPATN
jgi:T5orf172 domain